MSSNLFLSVSALALATLLTTANAHAEDSAPTASRQDVLLDAVTVSAGRGTELKTLDVSTTTISRTQVQQAPETTIDQIVNKIPGVFTSQQPSAQLHPTGQEFSIRGFGTTTNVNTLVMVDGAPMNDPYFRTVDWGQLPVGQVDRIEVIRGGGASSLWGNLAMGGIVNVITRRPGVGDNLLQVSYGSFNTYSADASLGYALTDSLRVGVTYDVAKTDGYNQTPEIYRNPNMDAAASQNTNVSASLVYVPSAKANFYLKFLDHRIAERGLTYNIARNFWDTERLTTGGAVRLSERTSVNVDGWYGWNKMGTTNASTPGYTIFTPTVGVPFVSQTETVRYHSYGGAVFVTSAFGVIEDIKVGFDARSITANDPLNLFSATAQTGTLDARATHRFEGIFAQGVVRPKGLPLDITLGLREDFWQTTGGALDGVYKGATFSNVLPDLTYSHFDPRLGLKYRLTEFLDLRAAVYQNFAAPGMNQMYRSFISGANYTTTNPRLTAQTNRGAEIGADLTLAAFDLTVTGFTNSLKNFIDYAVVQSGCAAANSYCGTGIATISGGSLRQYVNAGNAVFRGVEVIGGWRPTRTLDLQAGFTRTDAHLTRSDYNTVTAGVAPDPVGQQIGQVPAWIATAGGTWRATARLELTVQLKSFPAYWNNTSHTQRNDGATLVDIGGSYRLAKGLTAYGLIQNVGSARYYDQGLGYTATNGSTVSGSTVPALGMPLNATVGLRAAF